MLPPSSKSLTQREWKFQSSLPLAFSPARVAFHGDVGLSTSRKTITVARKPAEGISMSNTMGSGVFTLSPAVIGTLLNVEDSFELARLLWELR